MIRSRRTVAALMCAVALGACAVPAGVPSDQAITAQVRAKISEDTALKPFNISVATVNGVVELAGEVDSDYSATKAAAYARRVDGVKSVASKLVIKRVQ
jgi:hyperosmotically inducible protein